MKMDHLAGTPLAITSASKHKEEAWSFLRQQLLPNKGTVDISGNGFYINRTDFEQAMELVMTPKMDEINGDLQEIPRMNYEVPGGGDHISIDALTQEEYDQLMDLYNATEGTSDYDINLMNIITEQAGAYFAGDRSLDDTVAAIQSRVELYLAELQ